MNKRRLPIGIQTFREIREDNSYYVDNRQHSAVTRRGHALFAALRQEPDLDL